MKFTLSRSLILTVLMPLPKQNSIRKRSDTMSKLRTDIPIACDLTVFTDEQRDHHLALAQELFAMVTHVDDLAEGYAVCFPYARETLFKLADFVHDESQCCPFFNFVIEVEPQQGPIWLNLIGGEAVKVFLKDEMRGLLQESVAQAAGF
jgi:hypothetical protein